VKPDLEMFCLFFFTPSCLLMVLVCGFFRSSRKEQCASCEAFSVPGRQCVNAEDNDESMRGSIHKYII